MKRLVSLALLPLVALALAEDAPAGDSKLDQNRAALQALNEFIGSWQGDGKLPKTKDSWPETLEWGWRFKGDTCWLTFKVKDGKMFKSGEMKYLPDKKLYEFTALDLKDQKLVFQGKIEKDVLTVERVDPKTRDQQQIVMFNGADGAFFNYRYSHAPEGGKLFIQDFEVRAKKVSVVIRRKGAECIVSGGLATGFVTYKGKTYYICCSGCRDAFNENPEKYIEEFEARKRK